MDISGTTIDDQGVHLSVNGSVRLPPTFTVRLLSDPSGVTFAPSSDCTIVQGGRSAGCTATAASPTSYTAELPFDTENGPESADVSIRVDLPSGFELSAGSADLASHRYTRPSRDVDVALTLPATVIHPGTNDVYDISGQLTGAAGMGLADVTYRVVGGMFAGTDPMSRVTTRPASMSNPSFVVLPDNPAAPDVSITVEVASPFHDTTAPTTAVASPCDATT